MDTNQQIERSCSFLIELLTHSHSEEQHPLDIKDKPPYIFHSLGQPSPFDSLAQNISWLFHQQRQTHARPENSKKEINVSMVLMLSISLSLYFEKHLTHKNF